MEEFDRVLEKEVTLKEEYNKYVKIIKQARIDNNLSAEVLPTTPFKDFESKGGEP